jgi:hypothetical protein
MSSKDSSTPIDRSDVAELLRLVAEDRAESAPPQTRQPEDRRCR